MLCCGVVYSDVEENSDGEEGPSHSKRSSGSVFENDFYQKQFAKRRRVCWMHLPPAGK